MVMQKQYTSLCAAFVGAWALAGLLALGSGQKEYIGMPASRGVQQLRKSKIGLMAGGGGDPRYRASNYGGITGEYLVNKIAVIANGDGGAKISQKPMDGIDPRYIHSNYGVWGPTEFGAVAGVAVAAITLLGFAATSRAAPMATSAVPASTVVQMSELPTETKQQAPDRL